MSKSAPKAPDYAAAAQTQADSSRDITEQQTWANRPTINTPFGSQSWDVSPQYDPTTGQNLNTWEQNTTLTPEAQSALDSQLRLTQGRSNLAEGLLGRAQGEYGSPMDWSQFTQLSEGPEAGNYQAQDVQRNLDTSGLQDVNASQDYYGNAGDAIYNQFSSRNEPQFTRDTDALRTQLYNQGLREGDEGYDREIEKMRQSQNDARQQASYQATIGAGSEAQRMQGMDLGLRGQQFDEAGSKGAFANSAADQTLRQQMAAGGQNFSEQQASSGYQNTLRQQEIAEQMQQRGFSLNEINAILSGQQVGMPSMPGFNSAQASQPVQALGAAQMQGQASLDAFNAQQAGTQGLLSAAMMPFSFSDRRLKENIVHIGTGFRDLPIYLFNYLGCTLKNVGYMADEVEQLFPEAVVVHESGYKMVNYGLLSPE